MKTQKITLKDCYAELERICQLIVYRKQDSKSLEYCRKALQNILEQLAFLHDDKRQKCEDTEHEKKYRTQMRPYQEGTT